MANKPILDAAKSVLYSMSFVPNPEKLNRGDGISALVASRNEPFLEPSLESINNLVDEIILVDSSTGKWRDLVERVCARNPKIQYVFMEPDYMEQMRTGILLTTKRWILKWDADFIAFPRISNLTTLIDSLGSFRYHAIYFPVNNVEIDLFHTDPKSPFHQGHRLFQYSSRLLRPTTSLLKQSQRFRMKLKGALPARTAYGPFPPWYKKVKLKQPLALHLKSVKPRKRFVERRFQQHWTLLSSDEKKRYGNLDNYISEKLGSRGITYEKFCDIQIERIRKNLVPYAGEHPELLKLWIEENLDVEFSQSDEFDIRLKEFLSE
jgi:hypothetical protein